MFPCRWCRRDREEQAGRLEKEGRRASKPHAASGFAGKVAGSCVLRLPGRALAAAAAGQPTLVPATARPRTGAPVHPQRPSPARPAASAALWPARSGHARPRNFRRRPRAGGKDARSWADAGRATTEPTGKGSHRPPRPRGAARPGPQAGTKQK